MLCKFYILNVFLCRTPSTAWNLDWVRVFRSRHCWEPSKPVTATCKRATTIESTCGRVPTLLSWWSCLAYRSTCCAASSTTRGKCARSLFYWLKNTQTHICLSLCPLTLSSILCFVPSKCPWADNSWSLSSTLLSLLPCCDDDNHFLLDSADQMRLKLISKLLLCDGSNQEHDFMMFLDYQRTSFVFLYDTMFYSSLYRV